MESGEIVRIAMLQADGKIKPRPAVLLKQFPPYEDWLICGISSSLGLEVEGFDVVIDAKHDDFAITKLRYPSLIRLGWLNVFPKNHILGRIGTLSGETHQLLLKRLADYLRK